MGLGALISGLLFGGAAIKAGIENADMMKEPYSYLDDGTPVYLDRKCQRWANGEKIIHKAEHDAKGNIKLVDVGQKSGKVYFDPEVALQSRRDKENQEKINRALEAGKLAYLKYDPKREKELTCEISTNKYIAELVAKKRKGVWRYYKIYLPEYRKFYECHRGEEGDKGVEITKEEFDKLNIWRGSHFTHEDKPWLAMKKGNKFVDVPLQNIYIDEDDNYYIQDDGKIFAKTDVGKVELTEDEGYIENGILYLKKETEYIKILSEGAY